MTVLVVDDEAPIRMLCRVNLESHGFRVLEAEDGPRGLEKARAEQPDLILLGVTMPGLDGFDVARGLQRDPATRDIPFVFLTARAEFQDRARGLGLGAVDYVTKPFNPLELGPLIRETLVRIGRGESEELRREMAAELRALMEDDAAKDADGSPVLQPSRAAETSRGDDKLSELQAHTHVADEASVDEANGASVAGPPSRIAEKTVSARPSAIRRSHHRWVVGPVVIEVNREHWLYRAVGFVGGVLGFGFFLALGLSGFFWGLGDEENMVDTGGSWQAGLFTMAMFLGPLFLIVLLIFFAPVVAKAKNLFAPVVAKAKNRKK